MTDQPGGPDPMLTHRPTPEQLERLEVARHGAFLTETAVAAAFAQLSQALAEHSEASLALTRAIGDVLYGPQDETAEQPKGQVYEPTEGTTSTDAPLPSAAPGG